MDFETIVNTTTLILNALPFTWVDTALQVIGGAAVVATAVAKPKSQWARKAHWLINALGFNFGKAKNQD